MEISDEEFLHRESKQIISNPAERDVLNKPLIFRVNNFVGGGA